MVVIDALGNLKRFAAFDRIEPPPERLSRVEASGKTRHSIT
jgi:hypothetical protein